MARPDLWQPPVALELVLVMGFEWSPAQGIKELGRPEDRICPREIVTRKKLGYSVIGMTNMPEAELAREAEICYATVAMVHRFRLLASRPRRVNCPRHHQGAQRRKSQTPGRAWPAIFPASTSRESVPTALSTMP